MKKFYKCIGIAFLSVFLFLATIGLIELACKVLLMAGKEPANIHSRPQAPLNSIEDIKRAAVQETDKNSAMAKRLLAYGIEEYFLKPKIESPTFILEPTIYLNGLHTSKAFSYSLFPADIDDVFIKIGTRTREEKLRYHIKSNQFHRRDTAAERKRASQNIFFYGCSFTFGEGVAEEDTIPYLVSELLEIRGFNFGQIGAGPADNLKNLEDHGERLLGGIPDAPTTIVYTFIDDHVRRTIRSSHHLMMIPNGHKDRYFYRMDDQGQLSGILGIDSKFSDFYWFWSIFGKSSFAQITAMELPWLNEYHYRMFAKILAKQRDLTRERHPQVKDFVIGIFPGETFFVNILRPYLEEEGLKIFDYSMVGPGVLNSYQLIPKDGHPSADFYRLYAWLLAGDLQNLSEFKVLNTSYPVKKK